MDHRGSGSSPLFPLVLNATNTHTIPHPLGAPDGCETASQSRCTPGMPSYLAKRMTESTNEQSQDNYQDNDNFQLTGNGMKAL